MAWPFIDPTSPQPTDKVKFGDDVIRTGKSNTITAFQMISNYQDNAGTVPALKTAVWTTATRPTGGDLVDRVTGYNTTLGYEEYYDLATTSWKAKGFSSGGGNLTGAINEAKGTDIASATTTDIGAATGNYVHVTGTTTITGLGTVQAGTRRIVKFTGALTLTHNATSLILPGGTNITTVAGDIAEFVSLGSGNWVCVFYQRADGSPLTMIKPSVQGMFKNLKITNGATPASQVAVTADQVMLFNASSAAYLASGVSLTISTGSSGANGLDTGSAASNTWYSVWVIYNGSTVAGLLSTSETSPTMPSGYTYKARVGYVRTNSSGYLYRFVQYGNKFQYIVDGTILTGLRELAGASQGNPTAGTYVSVSVSSFVPPTASAINVMVSGYDGGYYVAAVAPNSNYAGIRSATNPPPLASSWYIKASAYMLLESTSIYVATESSAKIFCLGWEDNL